MIFFAQRCKLPHPIRVGTLIEICKGLGLTFDTMDDFLLKVWLGITYISCRDSWRKRYYKNGQALKEEDIIAVAAPTFIVFPSPEEGEKAGGFLDIITFEKACLDGSKLLIQEVLGEGVEYTSLTVDKFPENAKVGHVRFLDRSKNIEQGTDFDQLVKLKILPRATNELEYRSVHFVTEYPFAQGTSLVNIGVEPDGVSLSTISDEQFGDLLNEENQEQIIRQVSELLTKLYTNPAKLCTI